MSGASRGAAVAERLAEFVVTIRSDELPTHVRDDARWRVTDTLGVALAGSRMESTPARLLDTWAGSNPEPYVSLYCPKA
jgi:2-methylcitrate dehydratase PrpD